MKNDSVSPVPPAPSSQRVYLMDEVRGAAILLMVLYHAGYDLVAIFGIDFPFFFSPQLNFVRDCMAGAFILISGCACRFSRANLKRGAITLGMGMLMTLATLWVIPQQKILFGVLHCLGVCMILFALLRTRLDKMNPAIGAVIAVGLFYLTYTIPLGIFGGVTYHFQIPNTLYSVGWLFPLGFPADTFYSSDYYPLIPWFFLFLCGSFLGVVIKAGNAPSFFYRSHVRPLAFVGRHTLYIYLLHQPILYGLMSLVFYFVTK